MEPRGVPKGNIPFGTPPLISDKNMTNNPY